MIDQTTKAILTRYATNMICSLLQKSWYPTPGTLVKLCSENGKFLKKHVEYIHLVESINLPIQYEMNTTYLFLNKFRNKELDINHVYLVTSINVKKRFNLFHMRYITMGDITLMSELGKCINIKWTPADRISLVGFIGLLEEINV